MKLHIPAGLANKLAKPVAKIKNASPEILLGAGLASIGVGVVWACKNTLHINDVLDTHEHRMNKVEEGLKRFDRKTYSEQDAKKDKVQIFTKTAVDLVKLYAVPTLLISGGVACILCSHNVMSKRNAALLESANIANAALDAYQKRVAERLGEDEAATLARPTIEVDEKPQGHETASVINSYGAFFDDSNSNWTGAVDQDRLFLRCQERYANDMLRARGHLFLNEVYEMLGMPHTPAGAVCGWIKDSATGDGYVDFGEIAGEYEEAVVNGKHVYFIVPNVDGVIYDKI